MHAPVRAIPVAVLLLASATAQAAIDEDWNAGTEAIRNGDYRSALAFFESARDQGLDSAAVHYNIGVAEFRLGDYAAARETFTAIRRRFPPMRGLAEYNLGLIALRSQNTVAARTHFLEAYRRSPDERKIRILASRSLRALQPDLRPAPRWAGLLGLRAGYDDNVVLRDNAGLPAGTTTESPVTDLFASVSGPWTRESGFRLAADAYLLRYADADDFDQFQAGAGAFYDWRPGNWRLQIGARASALTLGGDAYDRKVGPRLRVVRVLTPESSIELRYTYDDIMEGDDRFAGIAGDRQRVNAGYRWYRNDHRLRLSYRAESNDRLDPAVSPRRNQVGVDYAFHPDRGFGFEAGLDFRQSDYDDMAIPREEDLLRLNAGLSYNFGEQWRVLAEYRHADNESTDPAFAYARGRFTLGFLKLF